MTTIITKNGSGAPTAGQLSEGELAVDLTNKELYTKSGSTVIKIGSQGGSTGTFTDLTATSSFTSPGIDDNATSTAITIDANENVGIGTDAPAAMLEVKGSDTSARFRGVGSQLINLDFSDSPSTATMDVRNAATFNISKQGIPSLSIDQERNVGIGTDNPARKLETGGNNNGGAKANYIRITDTDTSATANNQQGGIEFYTNDAGNEGVTASIENIYAGSGAGSELTFNVAPNGAAGISEAMRIDASGKVGINTTNPSVYGGLVIAQDANTSSDGFAVVDSTLAQSAKLWCDGTNSYLSSGNTGNDPLILNTGGGNVGIGTSAPVDKFDVKASGDDERLVRISHPSSPTAAAGYFGFTDTGLGANTGVALGVQYAGGYYDALTIDRETRNVGIGTTNPTAKMVVEVGNNEPASSGNMDTGMVVQSGNGSRAINMGGSNTGGYNWINSAYANNSSVAANLVLMTGAQERMRIDASGNLLVGRTSTASAATDYGTQVYSNGVIYQFAGATGNSDIHRWHNGAGTKVAYLQGDGDLIITGTYSPSDERLKENIVDAPAGNLDDLRVRSYDWKADGSSVTHGFIAQELEVVAPYAVTKGETDDDMLAVDYSKLVPMMVKEIQDLKAEVAALKGA